MMARQFPRNVIEYKPIPVPEVRGYVALTIYPPGEWFGNPEYHVFVGGCGYGTRATLEEAEAFLLECAKEYCQRRIDAARAALDYWTQQIGRVGLERT